MTDTNGKVQRLWLEARCSTLGTSDHDEKMQLFLDVFIPSFGSLNDPNFKVLFGNGKELCNLVCKDFVHIAKHVLSSDKKHALQITSGKYQISLMTVLAFFVRADDNMAATTCTYELYGNYNICALLLMLHGQLLSIALEGPTDGLIESFSVDRMYLKLLLSILGCQHKDLAKRCVAECVNESAISTVLSTIGTLYASHVQVPRDIPETALSLFKKQQNLTTANVPLERIASNLEQTLATTPACKDGNSTTLVCLVCLLESILLVRQKIKFPATETLSFNALASALLNMEDAVNKGSEYAKRLIVCIDTFATSPRQEVPAAPRDRKHRNTILDLIPRSFSSLKDTLTPSADRGAADDAGLVVCAEVVECLTTLFVCATKESTIFLYGSELFKLAQMPTKCDVPRYVLDSCRENFLNLNELQLSFFFNFLFTISDKQNIDDFVGFIMEKMLSNDLVNLKSRGVLLDFFVAYSSHSVQNVSKLMKADLFSCCLAHLYFSPDNLPDMLTYVEKLSVLSKVLVRNAEVSSQLIKQETPLRILALMVETHAKRIDGAAIIFRDMFTSIVTKTGSFFNLIVGLIASSTDKKPWAPSTTPYLATLVATFQKGNFMEKAVTSNAIELCCTLVRDIDASPDPEVDLALLGCCLGFLLPLVSYSDVWSLVDTSIGTVARNPVITQFVIDLCCGVFRDSAALTVASKVFDHLCNAHPVFEREDIVTHGRYCIPQQPFCELQHLLKTLLCWSVKALEEKEEDAGDLAKTIESLLMLSDAKLPNTYVADFILKAGKHNVIVCARDIAGGDFKDLLFCNNYTLDAVAQKQDLWLAALRSGYSENFQNRYNIRFAGSSGATGAVVSDELWPSLDGYSTTIWVHWNYLSSGQSKDRKTVLWETKWASSAGHQYSLLLSLIPGRNCCAYTIVQDGAVSSVNLPFIPPGKWVHVATCHRGKLFNSNLKVFYNGVLVSSDTLPYPALGSIQTAASVAGVGVVLSNSTTIECTVGSTAEKPDGHLVSYFVSYSVYNFELSVENVLSLYSYGLQRRGVKWGSTGHDTVSLLSPFLPDEILRALEVCSGTKSLASVCQKQSVSLTPPPAAALVLLDVRAMKLTESSLHYLGNKNWSFINCASAKSTDFFLHGDHTPPQLGMSDEIDALLAHGAVYEWLKWTETIDGAASDHDVLAASAARKFICILAAANKRADLFAPSWDRFTSLFTSHVVRHPLVYLREVDSVKAFFAMCVKPIQDGARSANIVYSTTCLEHVLFNWKVLNVLPMASLSCVLEQLNELISPSNSYAVFNAVRFAAADFINGFVCGLLRELVPMDVVEMGSAITSALLRASPQREELLSNYLMVCAVAVPTAGDAILCPNLVSKIPRISIDYICSVRNIFLRDLNAMWDLAGAAFRASFTRTLSHVVTPCWFTVMMSACSHPVTAALALRLFVICFFECEEFRDTFEDEGMMFLIDALAPHAHQQDISDLLMYAFIGHLHNPLLPRVPFSQLTVSSSHNLNSFLKIALFVVKRQSQIVFNEERVSCPRVDCRSYFHNVLGLACIPDGRVLSRKLKRCVRAVQFCVRLRRKESKVTDDGVTRASHLCNADEIKDGICEVMDWLTSQYAKDKRIRHAMYRSSSEMNPMDLISWPLLCSLHKGVESHSPPPELSPSNDIIGGDAESDSDDFEAVLPAVLEESKSYGLDRLVPRCGLESVYDSCRALFLALAVERVHKSDFFTQTRGRAGMNPYVLALHRMLSGALKGVGDRAEDWRCAFLCTVWLKASESSVDAHAKPPPTLIKNITALGKYLLDRFVSGLAVPPLGLCNYFRFLIERLPEQRDVVRTARTALFEWAMYLLKWDHYKNSSDRVIDTIDMVFTCEDVLFRQPLPTADLLQTVLCRLLQLTYAFLQNITAEGHACEKKLVALWVDVLTANRNVPQLAPFFQKSGEVDLWTGGFGLLLLSTPEREIFLDFIHERKMALWRCSQQTVPAFVLAIAEGGKYLKSFSKTCAGYQKVYNNYFRMLADVRKSNETAWGMLVNTMSFVDPALLHITRLKFPTCCILGERPKQRDELRQWYMHPTGVLGIREFYENENVEDLCGTHLSQYIRYSPLLCLPLGEQKDQKNTTNVNLKPNALSILNKITGPLPDGRIHWIGNVYYVTGVDSYICTLVVSEREVIIISCSQTTPSGDFFVARARPHAAAQMTFQKSALKQEALRLFTRGPATNTKAAFRFSQYYRQLRSEADQNGDAFVWRCCLGNITTIHQRLFQHMPAALEIDLETGEQFFVVVLNDEFSFSKTRRDRLQSTIAELAPRAVVETSGQKKVNLTLLTRQWAQRDISNWAYIRAINDCASRTVADIGQYPVFPWVLRDYASATLNLEDDAVYRDLSKPMGALNATKAAQLSARYREWVSDQGEQPYHYGTHYSSSAVALYYLVRLQPFTNISKKYQGGKLDLADRLFHSIPEAWESSSGASSGDVKELIPEFFRLSSFLVNINQLKLGRRRDDAELNDVVLPPWAGGSTSRFIHLHRLSLESEHVSRNLNQWIDLVFGFKQQGEEAVRAVNVFSSLSYHEGVERAINAASSEEERRSIVASADNFGQTPEQLFVKSAHVKRVPVTEANIVQQYLIHNVTLVFKQSPGSVEYLFMPPPTAAASCVCNVDGVYFTGSTRHCVSTLKPMQLFRYDDNKDVITCTIAKTRRYVSSSPPIQSFGCGDFSCMCVSATGNVLCVGTGEGKVIVFARGGVSSRMYVVAVLNAPKADRGNPVLSLSYFDPGVLIVTFANESVVAGWHVSCWRTMLMFEISTPDHPDKSAVTSVCKDDERNLFFGAKRNSVVLFTAQGHILSILDICGAATAGDPPCAASVPLHLGSIRCITFCNCPSFSSRELFLLGHEDNTISFWALDADSSCNTDTASYRFFRASFVHALIVKSDISSLVFVLSELAVGIGYSDGSVDVMRFPSPNKEVE